MRLCFCRACGATTVDLHHKTYERLGCELLSDLQALCRDCHATAHGKTSPLQMGTQRPRKRRASSAPDWTDAYHRERGASESAAIAADAGMDPT